MAHDKGKPFRDYVDAQNGVVDRAIFSDQAIYDMELERIFARGWNFMCHESQIPKPGDFFLNYIGEESVIATRDKSGKLQVFLNSCRHRGNAVCRAEQGNTRSFLCTYHGWTYDLEGKLIGVPGYKDLYCSKLDRSQWGLIKAGKVASYKGFVFATMDPEAIDLEEFLGPVGRLGLDLVAGRGEIVAINGVQKNQIRTNWKLAVDNLFDFYHATTTHASAIMVAPQRPAKNKSATLQSQFRSILGDYGNAIGGPKLPLDVINNMDVQVGLDEPSRDESWRKRVASAAQELGPVGMETIGHPNIFPNLWISTSGTQLCLRLPKGPEMTELWWFTILEKGLPESTTKKLVTSANYFFGPAGVFEQDDGENWESSTQQTRGIVARRYPLHFAMGKGLGQVQTPPPEDGPPFIDSTVNEYCQMWTYQAWADWMDAESWAALKRDRTPVPTEVY